MMPMKSNEKVSIVIVCYNEGTLLNRALNSVFAQTNKDFELVVVKNASPCVETLIICKELEGRANVKVIFRETNEGNVAARNHGFQVASGDILISLDGDDVLPPDVVAIVKDTFAAHPEADYIFGDYRLINRDTGASKIMDCSVLADDRGWLIGRRFAEGKMFHGTAPCRRSTWQQVGGYKASLLGWQDVEFWMRVIASGARGLYVHSVLYEWYRTSKGVNASTPQFRLWQVNLENRRFHEKFGDWNMTCEGFLHYASLEFADPRARQLMRRFGWRLFPFPCALWRLYVAACLKCYLPLTMSQAIVKMKRKLKERSTM